MADLIERDAVLETFAEMLDTPDFDVIARCYSEADAQKAIQAFKEIPAANRWIPCSEQMPDENTDVMIYAATQLFLNTSVARLIGGTWFEYSILSGLRQLDGFEVLAWMPMPEAYKEDSENG